MLEDMDVKLEYRDNGDKLQEYIRGCLQEYHMTQSICALDFAVQMHRGQKRKEGIPYIVHPMTMACHALSLGIREDDLLAVILLHDVCEDCPVEPEELPVNENIKKGVVCMTFERREGETKEDALERYYKRMRESREACLTKLFDRCHNVSSMAKAFSGSKINSYIMETRKYIYPLFDCVKERYPEWTEIVFVLEYHMKSVIGAFQIQKE